MSKFVKQEVTYKCDICGNECTPVGEVSINVGYTAEDIVRIRFKPVAYVPYYTNSGDVCPKCLYEGLKRFIIDLEKTINKR